MGATKGPVGPSGWRRARMSPGLALAAHYLTPAPHTIRA
jgi:hypothetical protein